MKYFQRGIYGIISGLEKCRYQMNQNHSGVNVNTLARTEALCGISLVTAAKGHLLHSHGMLGSAPLGPLEALQPPVT